MLRTTDGPRLLGHMIAATLLFSVALAGLAIFGNELVRILSIGAAIAAAQSQIAAQDLESKDPVVALNSYRMSIWCMWIAYTLLAWALVAFVIGALWRLF